MVSFLDLKANRKNSLAELNEGLVKINTPIYNNTDDRFWYPKQDKAGNAFAVIRFLPDKLDLDTEVVPEAKVNCISGVMVRLWKHEFQGPTGSWYIENCLTTIGRQDPVTEYNNAFWNTGVDSDKEVARAQKRKLIFIANILVIKDKETPENEGKVFLFRFGKKLFDKINDMMNPKFPGDEPINPFDFWEGCPLKLSIKKVAGFNNYDASEFVKPPSALSKDDKELEAIWKQEYSLREFLTEKNFKSYEELDARLNKVLGSTGKAKPSPEDRRTAAEDPPFDPDPPKSKRPARALPRVEDDEDEEADDRKAKLFEKLKNLNAVD